MSNQKFLTTREVADLCRVSDATVKRWEEAGQLESERTCGGHRRFRIEEVARFQRTQGLGLKHCYGEEPGAPAAAKRLGTKNEPDPTLFQTLLAGCEEETTQLLINEHLHGKSLTDIFDDLISSTMQRIGELWYQGELTVAQEHLATRAILGSLHKFRLTLPMPQTTGKLAICCAIEGDFHELPTHLAQITFENEGWEVMNFGANTPLYSVTEEILHHSPEIICISATIMSDIERLSRDYIEFSECVGKLKIPVILGGRVFESEPVRRRFPAELYAEKFADLAEFVQPLSAKS